MITRDQILLLSKKNKINESVIYREYLQILFLSVLYTRPQSEKIFFKGGTAVHLIYQAPRFSEDLDFTVELDENIFLSLLKDVFQQLSLQEQTTFKERKTIAGKRFLLTAHPTILPYKTFINLDFSFREKVIQPEKSSLKTDYPVVFTSYIHHLSKEEIFAEKIRALLTREKGRDLYDLWYLASKGVEINNNLVKEKAKYYQLTEITKEKIIDRLTRFSEKNFILDLKPFIPLNEREKLPFFFVYFKDYLKKHL